MSLLPPELVTSAQNQTINQWIAAHSFTPTGGPVANCDTVRQGFPLYLTLRVGGVDFTAGAGDMMTRISGHPAGGQVCIDNVVRAPLMSIFGPTAINASVFSFPAPVVYIGNNFLRNFYVTNTLPNPSATGSAADGSVTLGCSTVGAGRCTVASANPPSPPRPPAKVKLSADDDVGIAIGCVVVVIVLVIVVLYVRDGATTKKGSLKTRGPLDSYENTTGPRGNDSLNWALLESDSDESSL
jgi:hypothetical protein